MQETRQLSRHAGMVATGPATLAGGSDPLVAPVAAETKAVLRGAQRQSRPRGMTSAGSGAGRLLVYRRLVDLLDRRLELAIELLVGLAFRQSFEKSAREAGDEGGIACEPGAGFVTAVAARQGDDAEDARVRRQVAVQARPGRDGDLQYHGRALRQRLDVFGD